MVQVDIEWTESGRINAISEASGRLLRKMSASAGPACVWSLSDVVWPGLDVSRIDDQFLNGARLAMVPLSRIGQMEGKSGSLVLVARFWAPSQERPSHPLIVKTRMKDPQSSQGLADEWRRAQAAKPNTYDRKDSFAIPISFDNESEYEVLWSLCMPTTRETEVSAPNYQVFPAVADLRTLLVQKLQESAEETTRKHRAAGTALEAAYALLRNLHRPAAEGGSSPTCTSRGWSDEYSKYLRRYDALGAQGSIWGPEWAPVWRSSTERPDKVSSSPPTVVERLMSASAFMQVGTVHGDLHPGNIILRDGDPPAIIDFGWSQEIAHIAKDFALMECNIRFLTLRPQVSDVDLAKFAEWLEWGVEPPGFEAPYMNERAVLVQAVRAAAAKVFAPDTNWIQQYVFPLFLTAFGLLRFSPQLGNQRSAVLTVESLARYVAAALDKETGAK